MTQSTPEVLADGFRFLEAPRWHDGHLHVVDMHAGLVLRLGADGEASTLADMGTEVGGIGWLPDGGLLVVLPHERHVVRVTEGRAELHADLSGTGSAPLNDMWVDALGRAYVGDMGFDIHEFGRLTAAGEAEKAMALFSPAPVHLVDVDGSVRSAAPGPLLFPNGIMTSPTTGELVVAESFGLKLSVWQAQPDGTITDPRDIALGFAPDGICVDDAGNVWVADPTGNRAVQYDVSGTLLREIPLDRKCISLAVGEGDLWIATSEHTDPLDTHQHRSARIERVQL